MAAKKIYEAAALNAGTVNIDFGMPGTKEALLFITVTVNSGSPTVDVDFQVSGDGTNYVSHTAASQVTTSTTTLTKIATYTGTLGRLELVVAGTSPDVDVALYWDA